MYLGNLPDPVSSRGDWQFALTLDASTATDPNAFVFTVNIYPVQQDDDCDGAVFDGTFAPLLTASTNDGTGRLTAAISGTTIVVTYLFLVAQRGWSWTGPYEASFLAKTGTSTDEPARFRFTVV